MPDSPQNLAARLRHLALDYDHPDSASAREVAAFETLTAAADRLEELEQRAYPRRVAAVPGVTYTAATLGELVAPAGFRFVGAALEAKVADRLGEQDALEVVAEERGRSAEALRFFVVRWPTTTPPIAPGTIVQTQPAGALWRLHAFERLEVGGRLATLEPVDPHDVPPTARVQVLPLTVLEVVDGEPAAYTRTLPEASDVLLCGSTFKPDPENPELEATCERVNLHDGEHLGAADGREYVWVTASDRHVPRAVPVDSPEAVAAREREGVMA